MVLTLRDTSFPLVALRGRKFFTRIFDFIIDLAAMPRSVEF